MIAKRIAYWSLPSLFCLLFYWHGLTAWFQMDDFAWLSLHTLVSDFDSLVRALFEPMAQGTIRPLSERLFFLGFWNLFGMEALPYRICVFVTQFANLVLITAIVRKLTGSALAGFAAPLLWLVSPVLYLPMVWTSAYNQILCAFFLLLQFYLLLRYVESGSRRTYAALWIAFLLGFGALELNVVFPAIAIVYLLLFARPYLISVAPMVLVSVVYVFWHQAVTSALRTAAYTPDYRPLSLYRAFADYLDYAVSARPIAGRAGLSPLMLQSFSWAVWIAVALFIVWMVRKRQWLIAVFLGWFCITLAPYLPLSEHISDYYLTVPVIGLAMLGGWAISVAWKAGISVKLIALAAVILYGIPCAYQTYFMTRWYSDVSKRVRYVVRGLAAAHRQHPGKLIVLHGMDDELFYNSVFHRPEHVLGWRGVYVTAATQRIIIPLKEHGDISAWFLPDSVTLAGIRGGTAVVYDVSEGRLRNVTAAYERLLTISPELQLPALVDAGNPMHAGFLKSGWFPPENGMRWTMQRATATLRGPERAGGRLLIKGRVSTLHTSSSSLGVRLYVDGKRVGEQQIAKDAIEFELAFKLTDDAVEKRSIEVTVEAARTILAPPDTRQLGLLLGTLQVTP